MTSPLPGRAACLLRVATVGAVVALVLPAAALAGARPAHPAPPDATPFRVRPLAEPTRPLALRAPHGHLFTVRREAASLMAAAGARPLLPEVGIWQVPARDGAALRARLLDRGWLVDVSENRAVRLDAGARTGSDPLIGLQYAFGAIGRTTLVPPRARKRLFVIDSGLDPAHPDFAGKPGLDLANPQRVDRADPGAGEWHGTAVASIAAAEVNGSGMEGVYPGVPLGVWDAGTLSEGEIIAGLRAAVRRGYHVVNMSFGSFGISIPQLLAVDYAHRRGLLLVAAAGNEYEDPRRPNPDTFPALFPHVLTVASTDPGDRVASFSNRKDANDVSAPGVGVVGAVPAGFDLVAASFVPPAGCSPELPAAGGWCEVNGTSFSAPIVSAAAAWVWSARPKLTNDQLFNLLRFSARDVGRRGFERATGFGVVSLPNALRQRAPADDPQEPNEDVGLVDGRLLGGAPNPFVLPARRKVAWLDASLDFTEDPFDVYRVSMRRGGRLRVTVQARHDPIVVAVFRRQTRSVGFLDDVRGRDLLELATATRRRAGQLVVRAPATGPLYVLAMPARGSGGGEYRLRLRRVAG